MPSKITTYYKVALAGEIPEQIDDLEVWYDARQGVTFDGSNKVSRWDDRTGNHYADQPSGSLQPDYIASHASFNNTPVVQKLGIQELRVNGSSGISFTDFTFYAIYATVTANRIRHALAGKTANNWELDTHGTTVNMQVITDNVVRVATTNAHLGLIKAAWQNDKIFISGSEDTYTVQTSAPDFEFNGLLSNFATSLSWRGALSQFIGYNRKITTAEIASLDSWALTNFGA